MLNRDDVICVDDAVCHLSLKVTVIVERPVCAPAPPANVETPHFMPLRPIRDSRKDLLFQKSPASAIHPCNHGLDTLPSETLTHITSYLDPFELYAFARVCSAFNAHVTDDHTWRSAFLLNFFGIDSIEPESDKRTLKSLLLRRTEPTWKKEYVVRYNLRR